jgi:hypothetical protein
MTGLWNKNWWQNIIGVQLDLGPVCLLLRNADESVFTAKHRAHCSRILGRARWTVEADGSMRFLETSIATGANTLWLSTIIVYDGLLTGNDSKVETAFAFCNRELFHSPGAKVRATSGHEAALSVRASLQTWTNVDVRAGRLQEGWQLHATLGHQLRWRLWVRRPALGS